MKRIMIITILLLLIPIVFSASISTNKNNYYSGDTVFISGSGFLSNIDVIIQINDPRDTVKFVDQIRTGNKGKFSITYIILTDAITGSYTIYASGGGMQTQGNFTVSPTPITTTTVPSGGNGGNGGRKTTTTIIPSEITTTVLREVTTTRPETTTTISGVTTTILEEKRPIVSPRTITIIGVASVIPIILFVIFMKGLGS